MISIHRLEDGLRCMAAARCPSPPSGGPPTRRRSRSPGGRWCSSEPSCRASLCLKPSHEFAMQCRFLLLQGVLTVTVRMCLLHLPPAGSVSSGFLLPVSSVSSARQLSKEVERIVNPDSACVLLIYKFRASVQVLWEKKKTKGRKNT